MIAVEYPGYGIYPGRPNSNVISEDANTVFEFIVDNLNITHKDIFIFGRSMGSGPATELAALKDPGALILMSAYKSIRSVVKHIAGKFMSYLI